MVKLSWVTPEGSIGNFRLGTPASVDLIAAKIDHSNIRVQYKLINGYLPYGMTLNSNGTISGTPTTAESTANYFTTITSNFIVRAQADDGASIDGSFKIIITNTVNSNFRWITPAGDLGITTAGEFYRIKLKATDDLSTTISYSFISGELPPGLDLLPDGYLQGTPVILNPVKVNESQVYRFTARATNAANHVVDRAFYITITNVYGPIITPAQTDLGSYLDGTYYSQQLNVNELNPNVQIQWEVESGTLPPGITLSSTGLLSGFIQPVELVGNYGPMGYDADLVTDGVITTKQQYDKPPYDFQSISKNANYNFIIRAFDGANYDSQNYVIQVASRSGFSADNTVITIDTNYLTVDQGNVYVPVLLNSSTVLSTARQNSYYAFKFEGYDFQGDTLTYSLSNTIGTFDAYLKDADEGFDYAPFDSFNDRTAGTSNLPGLLLDAKSGWLFGKVSPQSSSLETYNFGVYVSKTHGNVVYSSQPVYFTLPVLGDVNNQIEWITPSDLGTIDNGSVSELSIQARSVIGKPLVYTLYDHRGVPVRLPQGLRLLPSGDISGRVSFEAFCIDDYATTFDGGKLTIDRSYTFTVKVSTDDNSASSIREFTLKLNIIDKNPLENLYLKAMPAFDQRQIYASVISNPEIFPEELIYRPTDPYYGIKKDMEMLFCAGLQSEDLTAYENAMIRNHYTKVYNFGDVRTAIVLDQYYNVKYEVVYIDIIDPEELSSGASAPLEIDLPVANGYIDKNGIEHKIIYPNSTTNMKERLVEGVGYEDQSSLPPWMTSNQPDATSVNKFKTPLGYIKAVVLAYTKPGASNLIAYRLRNSGINFNRISFAVDRYIADTYYSTNFNTATGTYDTGYETTFDALPNRNVGDIIAQVNYGVSVPFSEINARSVSYINARGGLDGITSFKDGDTLIFVKQENFLNPGPYQGWIQYYSSWLGDVTTTPEIEGYDQNQQGVYDQYNIVPGFLEKVQGLDPINERGGVWKIKIINGIVNLIFVKEILINQRIRVLFGQTYASALMLYTIDLHPGQSVPYYVTYTPPAKYATAHPTTFNAGSTRFFSSRDQYYEPGSQDKYIKFPQFGAFN